MSDHLEKIKQTLFSKIHPEWKQFFKQKAAQQLKNCLMCMQQAGYFDKQSPNGFSNSVIPEPELIFRPFQYTGPDACKAIIIGQDPYPNTNKADGLCFSIKSGKIQASLTNIVRACGVPNSANLEHWAKQGILMINYSLTKSNKQVANFWKPLLQAVINRVPCCYILLWGKEAQQLDTSYHTRLCWGHPSSLNRNNNNSNNPDAFVNCDHFDKLRTYGLRFAQPGLELVCFTDGGCKNNGQPGAQAAWAWYIPEFINSRYNHQQAQDSGILLDKQTNQRAELTAVIKLFEYLIKNYKEPVCIKLVTDSRYTILLVNKCKNKNNLDSLANLDLCKTLDQLVVKICDELKCSIHIHHQPSHVSKKDQNNYNKEFIAGNEHADALCNKLLD